MQIVIGLILLIACVGMIVAGRPGAGQLVRLTKPWIKAYVLAALVAAVVGVSLVLNGWPS